MNIERVKRNIEELIKICEKISPHYFKKSSIFYEKFLMISKEMDIKEGMVVSYSSGEKLRKMINKNMVKNPYEQECVYLLEIITGQESYESIFKNKEKNKEIIKIIKAYMQYLFSELEMDRYIYDNDQELNLLINKSLEIIDLRDKIKYLKLATKSNRDIYEFDTHLLCNIIYPLSVYKNIINKSIDLLDGEKKPVFQKQVVNIYALHNKCLKKNMNYDEYKKKMEMYSETIKNYIHAKLNISRQINCYDENGKNISNLIDSKKRIMMLARVTRFLDITNKTKLSNVIKEFEWVDSIYLQRKTYDWLDMRYTDKECMFYINMDNNINLENNPLSHNKAYTTEYALCKNIAFLAMSCLKEILDKKFEIEGNNEYVIEECMIPANYEKKISIKGVAFSHKDFLQIKETIEDCVMEAFEKSKTSSSVDIRGKIEAVIRVVELNSKMLYNDISNDVKRKKKI